MPRQRHDEVRRPRGERRAPVAADRRVDALAVAPAPSFRTDTTLGAVRAGLAGCRFGSTEFVAGEAEDGRYAGAAVLADVLAGPADAPLARVLRADWPTVVPGGHQEDAAELAVAAGVAALPVLDTDRRLVGVLPAHSLLAALAREHREDMHRLAGIGAETGGAVHGPEDPPLRQVRRRLPWLVVGLALSAGAAAVMAGFERTLEAHVAVAFFIPSLVYITDAIGTQTEAIAVRGLAVQRAPLGRLMLVETATGALLGLTLGLLALAGVWFATGEWLLAAGVGLSLVFASILASLLGLLLPWTLAKAGFDPALGSGPVATILQDVLTIAIYLLVTVALSAP